MAGEDTPAGGHVVCAIMHIKRKRIERNPYSIPCSVMTATAIMGDAAG